MKAVHPLSAWRKKANLSQSELAEKLGVGPSQVSQIETGKRGASLDLALNIQKLAGADVPLESLLVEAQ